MKRRRTLFQWVILARCGPLRPIVAFMGHSGPLLCLQGKGLWRTSWYTINNIVRGSLDGLSRCGNIIT